MWSHVITAIDPNVAHSAVFHFLFYSMFILTALGLMFFFIALSKRIVLNSSVIILAALPYFFAHLSSSEVTGFHILTVVGLSAYPITSSLMVRHHYAHFGRDAMIPVSLLSAFSLALCLLFPERSGAVLLVLHLLLYASMIYTVSPAWKDPPTILLMLSILGVALYVSTAFFILGPRHYLYSSGVMSVILSILLGYGLRNRISGLLVHFNAVNELNNTLNHRIARLTGSIESCRRIILEKDLELYQMARHASLAELTTGIAHELAQPLTGIKGIAQNMIDDINMEEFENLQAVSELMKICTLVDKSSNIIDHIRNFSKKKSTEKKAIDLNRVILEAIDLINLQLKKNSIDLIFVLDETIPKIFGDRISLEQLIVNIVLNSKDAILEKGFESDEESGTIRISTFHADDTVSMVITDNGSGISDTILHKIWSPFFTTKKRDHGTGIGLSISSRILKDHNADVDIRSDRSGTRFTIRFPGMTPS